MQRVNLMLHAGAQRVEREQLAAVATPQATRTWQPIPHSTLLDGITSTLARNGLSIVNEAHGVTTDGARYFGLMQLASIGTTAALVLGIRNSHDMRFPAGIVCGAQVFVCDNLSFSGEIKLARKHTRFIIRDLPTLTDRAIGQLADMRVKQEARFIAYQNAEVSNIEAHDLAIRAVDANVLPVTRLPDLLKQWREPAHPEFAGRSLWSLFNGFTHVLKETALDMLPRRTQALHGILDVQCGLIGGPRIVCRHCHTPRIEGCACDQILAGQAV